MTRLRARWPAATFAIGATLLVVACSGGTPATPTPPPAATTAPAATTSTATPTPPATSTPSPTPAATTTATATPFPTAPAGPTPPPGYTESCAAAEPWGVQVAAPFVCIDTPASGATVPPGSDLVVRGYAGGSFESHVLVEVGGVLASAAADMIAARPVTYVAPDIGMPGFWSTTIHLPASGLPSTLRVTASFSSPRDGSTVASESVDFSTR